MKKKSKDLGPEIKDSKLQIRWAKSERARIKEASERANLKESTFIRQAALNAADAILDSLEK